ncbi:MAG: cohesin domain-containing protein [Isosphaeraceae bacterium]
MNFSARLSQLRRRASLSRRSRLQRRPVVDLLEPRQLLTTITILDENFDALDTQQEVDVANPFANVWTGAAPSGWTYDIGGVSDDGKIDWQGWAFGRVEWWASVGGGQRADFSRGRGVVAIVDPERWGGAGSFETTITSPSIDVTAAAGGTATLRFDSSWVPAADQVARIYASFNGEAPVELLNWGSQGQDLKPAAPNEAVALPFDVPAGATNVMLTFELSDAVGGEYWAIDNLAIQSGDTTLYGEDFESLQPELFPSVDEGNPLDSPWTPDGPDGWDVDRAGVPDGGVTEFRGWSFMNRYFWSAAAGLAAGRESFDAARNLVAVVDPQQWDGMPHDSGPYGSGLTTGPISLVGVAPNTAVLTLDSSWRPGGSAGAYQTAEITVSYDGNAPVTVLRWSSDPASPNFHAEALNEPLTIPLSNPAGAGSVVVTFAMADGDTAGGFWAIDNLKATAVEADTLRVGSVEETDSGFVLDLTGPIDLGQLNLYDNAAGNLGPADVTVVGAATGAVRGSLVPSADGTKVTFIKTSGVLAPDTYTVTLRSAANGFVTPTGEALDGDFDNVPGGDYTTSFTVSAPPENVIVVSVPDFGRGRSQPVNVPANGSGLPIHLSNGAGVTSASITLNYDPALLSITGITALPAGSSATLDTSTPGVATISFTAPGLTTGAVDIVRLTAQVPDDAPYTAKQIIRLTDIDIKEGIGALPAIADDALHVAAYIGDVSGDSRINSGDVTLLRRVITNIDPGFVGAQLADPRSPAVGDINGGGSLDSADVTQIRRFITGQTTNFIPEKGPNVPSITGLDPRLYIPGGLTGQRGETITVPVRLLVTEDTPIGVSGFDLGITFDPARFSVGNLRLGSLVSGDPDKFDFLSRIDNAAGTIQITANSSTGNDKTFDPGQEGDLFLIDFTIKADAAAGASSINLRDELGNTSTGITNSLGDSLTLVPPPTDGADDSIDGGLTVVVAGLAGITVSPTSGLTTTEAGGTATFTVVLDSQPTGDVTIALSSSNTAEGIIDLGSLTFTPDNWDVPQTVTVTGVDDSVDDGDVAYTIVTAAATSSDAGYSGLDADDVSVTNLDDDTAGVTVADEWTRRRPRPAGRRRSRWSSTASPPATSPSRSPAPTRRRGPSARPRSPSPPTTGTHRRPSPSPASTTSSTTATSPSRSSPQRRPAPTRSTTDWNSPTSPSPTSMMTPRASPSLRPAA